MSLGSLLQQGLIAEWLLCSGITWIQDTEKQSMAILYR